MVFPGYGDVYVSPSARLALALAISFALTPLLDATMPPPPAEVFNGFVMIAGEIITGIFIGSIARILQGTLHVAGMIMAFQSSLASALLFDANQGSQGSVVGNMMTLIGITLIFVTDLHHLMIEGVYESYFLFAAGKLPPFNNFAELISNVVSGGFLVAVKISAPLLITGLLLYLGAGIMSRLMPSMQVFFVMIPIQLYVSFAVLAAIISGVMMIYLDYFREIMSGFLSL